MLNSGYIKLDIPGILSQSQADAKKKKKKSDQLWMNKKKHSNK